MPYRLHNDITRCQGNDCEAKRKCLRFLAIAQDVEHDREAGFSLPRSHTFSLHEEAPFSDCMYFIPERREYK